MVRSFGRELAIKVLVAALTDLRVVVFYDDTEARRSDESLSPDTPTPA